MGEKIKIEIGGMSCATCAANIDKSLNKEQGIIEANVNFATEKAQVEYNPEEITLDTIAKIIEKTGYEVLEMPEEKKDQKKTVKVDGMSCTACAKRIETVLGKQEGVKSINVNFAAEKMSIEYQEDQISFRTLQEKVQKMGFDFVLEEDQPEEEMDRDEAKVQKAQKKMMYSALISGTVMALMMVHMFVVAIPGYFYITALLAFPNIFILGKPVHKGSLNALRNKSPNMDVLVSLGSVPPYIVGLAAIVLPIQTFIEMATSIMTFHLIGKYLEIRAKGRASQAIKKLLQMGAKTAKVLKDGEEIEIPVKELQEGDVMIIRPGDKIPTDGLIIEGKSTVDESMATGESMPVKREKGDEVIGATINKQGMFKAKVTKVGKDTFLSQVIKMVEEAQGSKVPIQEFADRITSYFVPIIILVAVGTFISFNVFPEFHLSIVEWGAQFLPWVNPDLTPLTLSFITATAVFVIACPCALGLGTPTALMVGSGMGAEKGILIRNGEAVQTFKDVDLIAFDKTGTITKGKPEVTDVKSSKGFKDQEVIYFAATLEKASEHPLGHAIIERAKEDNISLGDVQDFESITGRGVEGTVDGEWVYVGNRKFMEEKGIAFEEVEDTLVTLEEEAKTAMLIAKEKDLLGVIAVADPIKEDSHKAIQKLESMGIKTAMITGDNQRTAKAIGKKVGISHVISEVLPDGKVDEVKRLQKEYNIVAMVGDGINDAPALKQANIGIAIGTGTDVAIEAADVTLVRGELSSIITAVNLSRLTFKKIKQNYFWAWFYNAVAIPIAVMGLLHPMIGAAAMSVSSLNVVYNSLRMKRKNIEPEF